MKHIYLLGATGSIGKQTLDIIKAQSHDFKLVAISGYGNFEAIVEITKSFHPEFVAVKDAEDARRIKAMFEDIRVAYGRKGLVELATYKAEDKDAYLVNALVGMVGLEPTIEAIKMNRHILLANKETLVVGGHLIKALRQRHEVNLYPIDSEHNALWQLMHHESKADIKRLIITASGGSFRDLDREALKDVKLEDALNHPNWSMGKKITIDSATMMNKGFEVIEACYLFDIDIGQVETVIHKESMIHAMVEFTDGSLLAHISHPDMHLPIAYAMNYPNRQVLNMTSVDILDLNKLSFSPMSYDRYPCLTYAIEAYKIGGSMRTVLNAANEAAVDLFLNQRIGFIDIETIIKHAMDQHDPIEDPSLEDIYRIDRAIKDMIYQAYR